MIWVERISSLAKGPVALLSSLSAATGFVLARGAVTGSVVPFFGAIFLLAAGTAILNQYQERSSDSAMERTKQRPIPAGEVSPAAALMASILSLCCGFILLGVLFGVIPVLLGVLSVVLYNGIYTYLKKITAFASIPGAVAGALPPLMGYSAAGGRLTDPLAVWLLVFFYIWQIPHFWLLMGIHGDDYRRANFPSLQTRLADLGLGRVVFNWIIATACVALLFPMFGDVQHSFIVILLSGLAFGTGWLVWPLTRKTDHSVAVFRRAFMVVNRFVLAFMILLFVDRGV